MLDMAIKRLVGGRELGVRVRVKKPGEVVGCRSNQSKSEDLYRASGLAKHSILETSPKVRKNGLEVKPHNHNVGKAKVLSSPRIPNVRFGVQYHLIFRQRGPTGSRISSSNLGEVHQTILG